MCCKCGRQGTTLFYVGGQDWCRSCLFDETYDFDKAVNYCLINQDKFADRYPEGYDKLWRSFCNGEELKEVEMFCSDYICDYAEWVMSNPKVVPYSVILEKVRRM